MAATWSGVLLSLAFAALFAAAAHRTSVNIEERRSMLSARRKRDLERGRVVGLLISGAWMANALVGLARLAI
jgi:hypothetical protein